MKNISLSVLSLSMTVFIVLAHTSWAMDYPESPIDAYKSLPKEKKNELFSNLKLKSGIVKEGDNIRLSSRESVTWKDFPHSTCVLRSWESDEGYSLSKTSHELKKSGLTNATAGAAYLGVGFDIECESKSVMLNCAREVEVYLLTTNTLATLELSISKEDIEVSDGFGGKIKKILAGNFDIASYRDLIEVFREYGFCIPTKFILGGQIGTESILKVKSVNEAKKKQESLSLMAQVPVCNTSGDVNIKHSKEKEEKRQELHVLSSNKQYMKGGDENLVEEPKKWRKELPRQINKWSVIETGDYIPIIDCLDAATKRKCWSLIRTFYKDDDKSLSLEGMQCAINNNFSLLDAFLEDLEAGRLVIGTDRSHRWGTVCKRNKPISAFYLQQISGKGGKVNIKKRLKRLQALKILQTAKGKSYFLTLPIINALFEDVAAGRLVIGTDNSHEWGTVHYKHHKPITACYLQKVAGLGGKGKTKTEEGRIHRLNNLKVLESVRSEISRCKGVLGESYPKEEKYSAIWNSNLKQIENKNKK